MRLLHVDLFFVEFLLSIHDFHSFPLKELKNIFSCVHVLPHSVQPIHHHSSPQCRMVLLVVGFMDLLRLLSKLLNLRLCCFQPLTARFGLLLGLSELLLFQPQETYERSSLGTCVTCDPPLQCGKSYPSIVGQTKSKSKTKKYTQRAFNFSRSYSVLYL